MTLELAGALFLLLLLILFLAPNSQDDPPPPAVIVTQAPQVQESGQSNVSVLLIALFVVAVLALVVAG